MKLPHLNREEFVMGAAFGVAVSTVPGALWYLLIPSCSLLWALGGTVNKAFRRFGVPLVVVAALWPPAPVTGLAAATVCLALHIGYGVPSTQPPDAGSALARLVGKLLPPALVDLATRAVYGGLCGLGFVFLGTVWPALMLMVLFPLIEEAVP